jgi:lactoylglutathione lyase
MITTVRSIGLYVSDQDRAKNFYTTTLGFTLIQDTPMGEEAGTPRWIEVAPPNKNVILVLFTPEGFRDRIGGFSNVIFHCDDIHVTHKELVERGVEFVDQPRKEVWGWWATFKDPDGNIYGLSQSGE